jgi:UDP-N-acetyl-D-mannosaminuronic acid dehydrogenase
LSENVDSRICVVGLGYVGLTLATVLAETGLEVHGLERREEVVDLVNAGRPHFSERGLEDALQRVVESGRLAAHLTLAGVDPFDVYIITVGTPLGPDGEARLDMISAASREVAEHMNDNALVILRSTVKVGTTRSVVTPILETAQKRFDIAMCPERTLEGRALVELRSLPQVVGADDGVVRARAAALFSRLTRTIVDVESPETAEVIKLVDNTYRDVRFAFANEVARACESFGVSAYQVIAAGKLGYPRTDVPIPGLVGGPCLEKDPHILLESGQDRGIDLEITRSARLVNERQPGETVTAIGAELARRGLATGPRIAVLGLAFKGVPSTDDLRGSMALRVIDEIRDRIPTATISVFDPVIAPERLMVAVPGVEAAGSVDDAVRGAAVAILANNHPHFADFPPSALRTKMVPGSFVYDYWNLFSHLQARSADPDYLAVGMARSSAP